MCHLLQVLAPPPMVFRTCEALRLLRLEHTKWPVDVPSPPAQRAIWELGFLRMHFTILDATPFTIPHLLFLV